jgi:DNA-binding MarR family transcriptional regulator
VTTTLDTEVGNASAEWLSDAEMAAWLPLVRVVTLLPQRLDRQLRDDAGIGHVYYQILAMLSDAPGQELRMSELAGLTCTSPSRMSHAVASLEARGWVARCPSEQDGRVQVTQLTDAGRAQLEQTAPGHVTEVRRRVFDPLTSDDVDHLQRIASTLLDSLSRDAVRS